VNVVFATCNRSVCGILFGQRQTAWQQCAACGYEPAPGASFDLSQLVIFTERAEMTDRFAAASASTTRDSRSIGSMGWARDAAC